MEEAYINLVNAIILQAFKDYHWAVKKLQKDSTHPDAHRIIFEVETFCRSDWLEILTDVDGEWLLERIKEWKK